MRTTRFTYNMQIFLALLGGLLFAAFFGELTFPLQQLGQLYLAISKIVILPFLSLLIVQAISKQDSKQLLPFFKIGAITLVSLWACFAISGYLFSFSFSASEIHYTATKEIGLSGFQQLPLLSLTDAFVPFIILLSVTLGAALSSNKRKNKLLNSLEEFSYSLQELAYFILKLAPLGIFALTSNRFGFFSLSKVSGAEAYLLTSIAFSLVLSFWLLPTVLSSITPVKYREVLKQLSTPLLLAFASNSIIICLPFLINSLEKISKQYTRKGEDQAPQELIGASSSIAFILPSGTS